MTYFLDTNICIYILKGTFPQLQQHIESHAPSELRIPAIVLAELYYGAYKSTVRDKAIETLREFTAPIQIAEFDSRSAVSYGAIRSKLESMGRLIGPNDLIVAATTLSNGGTLVTHNVKEFSAVPGLLFEDWTG
jgi:tRNA(fMet)-specific endonuclease VapC